MAQNKNKLKVKRNLLGSKKPLWSSYRQNEENQKNDGNDPNIEQVPVVFADIDDIPIIADNPVVNNEPLDIKKSVPQENNRRFFNTASDNSSDIEIPDNEVNISRQSMQRLAPKRAYERKKRNRKNAIGTFFARFLAIVLLLALAAGAIYGYAFLNKKEVKNIDEFYDFAKGRGYYVVLDSDDVTYNISGENILRRAFSKTKSEIIIEYYSFDTAKSAQNSFEKVVDKRNPIQKSQLLLENVLHFPPQKESEEITDSKGFSYCSRIGNTILYVTGKETYKNDILAIASAFKY